MIQHDFDQLMVDPQHRPCFHPGILEDTTCPAQDDRVQQSPVLGPIPYKRRIPLRNIQRRLKIHAFLPDLGNT